MFLRRSQYNVSGNEGKKKIDFTLLFFFLLLNLFAPAPERKMRHWKVTEFFFLEEDEIVIHSPQEEVEVDRS